MFDLGAIRFDYYEINDELDDPHERARNNMKAFQRDLEFGGVVRGFGRMTNTHEWESIPIDGRWMFVLEGCFINPEVEGSWRHSEVPFAHVIWMPGDQLDDVRYVNGGDGRTESTYRKILIDGEAKLWEDAIWDMYNELKVRWNDARLAEDRS